MENQLDIQADAFDAASSAAPAFAPTEALGHYLSNRRESMEMSLEEITRITKIPKASLLYLESGDFGKLPGDVFVRGFLRSYARCLKLDGDDVVRRYAQCGLHPAPVSSELAESLLAQNKSLRQASAGTVEGRPRRFPRATGAPENREGDASVSPPDGAVQSEISKGESVRNVLRDAFDLRHWQRSQSKEKGAKRGASKNDKVGKQSKTSKTACSSSREQSSSEIDAERATPRRERLFVPPRLDDSDEMSHRGPLTLGVIILVIVATLTMSYLLRRPGSSVDGFTMLSPTQVEAALLDVDTLES